MNVVIYIRVSTQEQALEGYSISEQKERLEAYCKAKDWHIQHVYVDPGFSGSNINRPGITQLLDDAKFKKFDGVLVYKLDRLSRSQKDTLYMIEDIFLKNDIAFVSMNENFDTSTAFGRAMIGILSVFAQLEREQIKERTQMGKDARAKEGLWHGGGFDPIGYDYIDGRLIVNEYEAMQVREIYDLFLKGVAIDRIAITLREKGYTTKYGNWNNHSAVRSVLLTKLYAGFIIWKGNEYIGQHKALVSKEMFDLAQKRYDSISWIKNNAISTPRPFQSVHLLTSLLYCGNCGQRYFAKGNNSTKNGVKYTRSYYTCYSRAKTKKRLINDPNCKNKSYFVDDLNEIIQNEIKKLSFDDGYFNELIETSEPTATNHNFAIETRITEIDKQTEKLIDLYQLDQIQPHQLNERLQKLIEEKTALQQQIKPVEQTETTLSIPAAKELLQSANDVFKHADMQTQKEFVLSLINRIELLNDDITIYWNFV